MASSKLGFLAANPRDKGISLRQTEELDRLKGALSASPLNRRVEIRERLTAKVVDLREISKTEQPEVLHFSGFEASREGGVLLENEDGYAAPVSTQQLLQIFKVSKYRPRLVFLNACNTAHTCAALTKYAQSAIGFKSDVTDDFSNVFSEALYRAIFSRVSVKQSFEKVNVAVKANDLVMRTMQLYNMDMDPAVLHASSGVDTATHLALVARPFSVFISYGGPDQKPAERLHDGWRQRV